MSTDTSLAHFGIKGMKWGVRHEIGRNGRVSGQPKLEPTPVLTKKFSTGDSISVYQDPPPFIARFLSARSAKYKAKADAYKSFTLKDKDGKKVGEASFNRVSQDELNLVWVGIRTQHRGKGYATAAMQGAVKYAQSEGIKKLTLEVPGNAPDARHIYEKFGFRDDPSRKDEVEYDPDDSWGGLTPMVLHVNKVKHAKEDVDAWAEQFANEFADFLSENFHDLSWGDGMNEDTIAIGHMMNNTDEFLAHFGIKGMKWGVRHQIGSNGRVTSSKYPDGSTLTREHKIAIGVGAASAVAIGGVIAAALIKRNGGQTLATVSRLRPNNPLRSAPNPASRIAIGQRTVEQILSADSTPTGPITLPRAASLQKQVKKVLTSEEFNKLWNDQKHVWAL